MKRNLLLSLLVIVASGVAFAQLPPIVLPPGASPQAPQDPGYQALIASCRAAPPQRGGGPAAAPGRTGGERGAAAAAAAPPATFPPPAAEYTVTAIPGVIAAGQKWTKVWEVSGNNADGIVATMDGGILYAQNDNSTVV